MGCCFPCTRSQADQEPLAEARPKYSWERESRPDRSQLIISGQEGVVTGRLPGQLNGRQFHIQDCKKSQLFILDHTSAVTVHGCSECDIVLGPCGGSVFIRECTDCTVVVACQQFRARDCRKCSVFLYCQTQPVIESSHKMKFGCYQMYYPQLKDQFTSANFDMFNNQWSLVHDFTGEAGGTEWSLLQETTPPISLPTEGELAQVGLTFSESTSVVPATSGVRMRPAEGETCMVAIAGEDKRETAMEFLKKVHRQLTLVQTCCVHFKASDAQTYFGSHEELLSKISKRSSILLDLTGINCLQVCRASLAGLPQDLYHLSSSAEEGQRESEALSNFNMTSLTM